MENEFVPKILSAGETLHSYEAQVSQMLEYIEQLHVYAEGELVDIPTIPVLTMEATLMLATENGKQFLQTWLRAFQGSISLAYDFLNRKDRALSDKGETLEALKMMVKSLERRAH
ncbi:MAG: hypothetical protein ACOH18_02685 [Candidatus Saccharimonadaceae bacterium]